MPAASFVAWRSPVLGVVTQSNASQNAVSDFVTRVLEAPGRAKFVAQPRRYGAMSLRMETRQLDTTGGGLSDRNDLIRTLPDYPPGSDFWLGISVLVDPTFPPSVVGDWCVLHQLFGATGGQTTGSPPFALEIGDNGNFHMSVRGGSKATATDTAPRENIQDIVPITKGVWHDFLFHLFLSTGSDGTVDGYHKLASDAAWPDTPTVSDVGVNVLTVGGVVQNTYNKLDIYRHTRAEIAVVYFGLLVIDPSRSVVETYFAQTAIDTRPTKALVMLGGVPVMLP